MTIINPNNLKQGVITETELWRKRKNELLKAINCIKIGTIVSYDPGVKGISAPTVSVQIAQQIVTSVDEDGVRTLADYPQLDKVPVQFLHGGRYIQTAPIAAGDECLVLFNDRELDNWHINGAGYAPTTPRFHDIADAICIMGVFSDPNAPGDISTDAFQIRSLDYTGADGTGELIELSEGKISIIADEVVIHARNKLAQDAGGTGSVTTPAQIDTYTDGVTTNHHAPNPPEVPT